MPAGNPGFSESVYSRTPSGVVLGVTREGIASLTKGKVQTGRRFDRHGSRPRDLFHT